jgi:hypothetical protein
MTVEKIEASLEKTNGHAVDQDSQGNESSWRKRDKPLGWLLIFLLIVSGIAFAIFKIDNSTILISGGLGLVPVLLGTNEIHKSIEERSIKNNEPINN